MRILPMRIRFSLLGGKAKAMARDAFGGVALTLAVTAPVGLGAVALGVDYATRSMLDSKLQGVADAAAIAGARELAISTSTEPLIRTVVDNFVEAQADKAWGPVTWTTKVDKRTSEVRVDIQQEWEPIFAKLFDSEVTPVKSDATAQLLSSTTKLCVLALDTAAGGAIHYDKTSVMQANGCAVYSNSVSASSIYIEMKAKVRASAICAAGGVVYPSSDSAQPTPVSDCPPVPDPLASREEPSVGACDHTDMVVDAGATTLSPGVYCGGLTITGNATVQLSEGTYAITGGKLIFAGNAKVAGDHVGFFLSGAGSEFNFNGRAQVSLTAPKSGAMAGLLFFQSRGGGERKHRISASKVDKLVGTIYLANGHLRIDPNARVAAESAYTAIIVKTLELDEGPDVVLNSDYGGTDVPVPDGLKGSGTVVLSR
jgi:Flp pilus assembly protein TadG